MSLIAAAKAKALELDELDDVLDHGLSIQASSLHALSHRDTAATSSYARSMPLSGADKFRAPLPFDRSGGTGTRSSAHPPQPQLQQHFDEDGSVDEFDQRMEMLLARSAGPPVVSKTHMHQPQPRAASGYSSGASAVLERADLSAIDSARSNNSVTSANSYQPRAMLEAGTWSAQHSRPSVGLAAARAQRREMHAAQQQAEARK